MKYLFPTLFGLFLSSGLIAQEVLENNPASLRWYKLRTPNFSVLYPQGFEDQAQRMANTLENVRTPEQRSLGANTRRIKVVLQNQSSLSNGFVSMVPRRSEFYTMPTQNYNFSGTNDWLNLLASHEFRHIAQFDGAKRGFSNLLYYLFGPATFSAMAQTSVPQWFWEGDAVVAETAYSQGGRGRIPNFGLVFRTNLLEGREFNYHKQYLRSYKDFITDHYVLGYHMVSYLHSKTKSPDSWGNITKRTWSVPFIPFAFSNSIKKETGLYVTQLYREMASSMRAEWQKQIDEVTLSSFNTLAHEQRHGYTNYNFPQELSDGRIIALKEGIGNIEQFVILSDSKEKTVFTPGLINDTGMLSVSGSWIVWNEFRFDPRWRVRNYSVITMYNVDTKELKTVTSKSRFGGASLSPDASKLVTVETATNYQTSLLILDTNGKELKRIENPTNAFYSMPRWSANPDEIVSLKTTGQGRSVVKLDINTGAESVLLEGGTENIGHPVLAGRFLYFNSGVSGIDNIYAVDLQSKDRFQVTSSKYGAYNPCVSNDGEKIFYNEQSRDGHEVVSIANDPAEWTPMSKVNTRPLYLADMLSKQEGRDLTKTVPSEKYTASRYHKISGVFNPYSWGAVFNESFTGLDVGIASRDILSTTSLKAGYMYDIYERTGTWRAGLSYQGWFPIIDLNFDYARREVDEGQVYLYNVVTATNDTTVIARDVTFNWEEANVEAGIRIPLLTTSSRFHGSLTFANYVGFTKVTNFRNTITNGRFVPLYIVDGVPTGNSGYPFFDYVDESNLQYNHFSISAYRLLKTSKRDINSKWGQRIEVDYYSTPYGGGLKGSLFSFIGIGYFPGFFRHHSLWGYWAYQKTDVNVSFEDYIFRNTTPGPRGVSVYRFEKFYSMSANYTFPIWYPDIAIGPLVNIQRLRGNLFYDYAFGNKVLYYNIVNQQYASVGGELKVDFNVMRALPQLNMGIRYSYDLKTSLAKFEILIGTINF